MVLINKKVSELSISQWRHNIVFLKPSYYFGFGQRQFLR